MAKAAKKTAKKAASKSKKRRPNPMGRPPIFTSEIELAEAGMAYFESCWEEEWKQVMRPEIKALPVEQRPEDKDEWYEWKPVKDRHGNVVKKQVRPYTINGLAFALGMTRETLRDYGEKEKFSDTIKRLKQVVQEYTEQQLYTPKIAAGVIFNLKNNYGWKDKTEVEHEASDSLAALIGLTREHGDSRETKTGAEA